MSTYRPTDRTIAHEYHQPITSLAFDPVSDILWTGSSSGAVVAYCTPQAIRGVSFPVGDGQPVQKLVAGDTYVRACGLAGQGVGSWTKGGVNKWYFRPTAKTTSFSNASGTTRGLAVATDTQELIYLNDLTGDVIRRTSVSGIINQLHFSHSLLLAGSSDGYIRSYDIRNPSRRTDSVENSVYAHAGGVQGLQSSGNYVYSIGWGYRQSIPFPDPLVKVYDLRTFKPLPPVPFSDCPAFICSLPKKDTSLVVVSNQGLVNIVDCADPSVSEFYQLDTHAVISSAAVSPTGAYLAFGDQSGVISILTAVDGNEQTPFNGFVEGQPIDWADPPEELPDIDWTDSTPLNAVGMPYYNTPLLSSWTKAFIPSRPKYFPPPDVIPPQILNTMKLNDNIAYAAVPKELRGRRNTVADVKKESGARFRSGKRTNSDADAAPPDEIGEIPRVYRKVEIEYSKFGVEDFDFGFYNKTSYSGLETHILNSYTNSMVQTMHYVYPIRRLAKSHITLNCPREHCLLCEFGFVVRMLEDAKGINCQASNFCRTVGVLAQGKGLIELVDYGRMPAGTDYAQIIQSFHRFFVDHLVAEGEMTPSNPVIVPDLGSYPPPPLTQLVGISAKTDNTCLSCRATRSKHDTTHILDMVYPRVTGTGEPSADFNSIIQDSLLREVTYKATCPFCRRVAVFESRRSFATKDLPPVLAVNTSVFNEENIKFWLDVKKRRFLTPSVSLHGQTDGVDDTEVAVYELRSVVVQVVTRHRHSHLIAIVKVPGSEEDPENISPWFVFNDFAVKNVSEEEALNFPDLWKVPAILYLERVDAREKIDFDAMAEEIDTSVLSRDSNISLNRDSNRIKHDLLHPNELPRAGMLVAIDAEFVSMQQEETEFRSDGTKKVIRPARLSLARVSVLRGDGPKGGVPFIDDHIHTSEMIVDYLTEWSGIKYGDLDPHLSPHTLTPLKIVYKKLRALVDRGCVFIGHGLSKDFRIINIFVPPEQVIDTVDLYFIKARQRRLSLKFLTWFVLGENIQTETHDSIEDARSALRLYKAYHEFEENGTFDEKLEELYREGKANNWKPPASVSPPPVEAPAPRLVIPGNRFNYSGSAAAHTTTTPQNPPQSFVVSGYNFPGVGWSGSGR